MALIFRFLILGLKIKAVVGRCLPPTLLSVCGLVVNIGVFNLQ